MIIRDATSDDLPAIAEIYNFSVVNTTNTWNDQPVDAEDRATWLRSHQATGYPVLIAEIAGAVAGYAAFTQWRNFTGYRHTVEHSVFVGENYQRRGVATALMKELLERARAHGAHVMIAGIDSSNTGSIALHEKLGFVVNGQFPQVGRKFGRWLDLTLMQLTLL